MVKRVHIEASKLTKPNFKDVKEAGCKGDKIGVCPMLSDLIPSEENGCQFCRKIKATWEFKEKILSLISESDLKHINYYELDNCDPVKKIIDCEFEKLGYLQGDVLLSFIKQYCSFDNDSYAIRVEDGGKIISEGRHRVKVAQNLSIKIPVHWV